VIPSQIGNIGFIRRGPPMKDWLYHTALAVLLVGLVVGVGLLAKHLRFGQFQAHIDEYFSLLDRIPQNLPVEDARYLKGKLLVINARARDIDHDLFMALPDDLKAKTHDEVGSLAVLDCGHNVVGYYSTGSDSKSPRGYNNTASREDCSLTVVDMGAPRVSAYRRFTGAEPPASIRVRAGGPGSASGGRPDSDMISYLSELPRSMAGFQARRVALAQARRVAGSIKTVRLQIDCKANSKVSSYDVHQFEYAAPGATELRAEDEAPVSARCGSSLEVVAGTVSIKSRNESHACSPPGFIVDSTDRDLKTLCGMTSDR
jgi:hypothetical protein